MDNVLKDCSPVVRCFTSICVKKISFRNEMHSSLFYSFYHINMVYQFILNSDTV